MPSSRRIRAVGMHPSTSCGSTMTSTSSGHTVPSLIPRPPGYPATFPLGKVRLRALMPLEDLWRRRQRHHDDPERVHPVGTPQVDRLGLALPAPGTADHVVVGRLR